MSTDNRALPKVSILNRKCAAGAESCPVSRDTVDQNSFFVTARNIFPSNTVEAMRTRTEKCSFCYGNIVRTEGSFLDTSAASKLFQAFERS